MELNVGFVCACLPTLRPLLNLIGTKWLKHIIEMIRNSQPGQTYDPIQPAWEKDGGMKRVDKSHQLGWLDREIGLDYNEEASFDEMSISSMVSAVVTRKLRSDEQQPFGVDLRRADVVELAV